MKILYHTDFQVSIKWVKVQGTHSPYDGDCIYWATKIGDKYKSLEKQKARLVKRQKGKCAYCGLHFGVEDELEKHHVEHKSKGGNNSDKNLALVHLHCHDQIHSSQKDVEKKLIWNGINKLEVV